MYKKVIGLSVLVAAAMSAVGVARAVEVKLCVEDSAKVARKDGIVTTGVPLAKSAVKDVARLSARVGNKVIPAQSLKLGM